MGQTRPALAESPRIAEVDVEAMTCPAADGLAERLHTGSKRAMAEVFSTHLDAIYNYCYRRSGSWSAAEDLTSSVFLEVWRSRQRAVELDGSLLPWLYGVATNVCRNHQRSQRRQARALVRLRLADVPNNQAAEDVVEQVDAEGRAARALERLAQLPVADQDVFPCLLGGAQLRRSC